MRIREMGRHLLVRAPGDDAGRYLYEMKRLEWIFIGARWLWVPAIFLLAWLHEPASNTTMVSIGAATALINVIATVLNMRIKTPVAQRTLGITMLLIDTAVAWGLILLFVHDFYTAAYAGFLFVLIEGTIRYGLAGSLSMAAFFAIGLFGAYIYRDVEYGVRFSSSGYTFWTILMFLIAVPVGLIVDEGRRQRHRSESYLKEKTLLEERQRIARDLHDNVIKTLHGLSLEAKVLESKAAQTPSVSEVARYIGEVCSRTSHEIRDVVLNLRSDSTEEGVASLVSGMLDAWSKKTGISSEFGLSGQDKVLPPETTRHLRNIVSEALTNVERHAAASHVVVSMKITDAALAMEIGDNGRGLGRSANELYAYISEGKLGIAGMRERIELLNGHFQLKSDGNGTRLMIELPLRQESSESDEPD